MKELIGFAYDVRDFQISGGPVFAKPPARAPGNQVRPMVQALLADRFRLAVHHKTRALPIYALVVAKNGPKLQRARDDETLAIRGGVFQKVDMPLLAKHLSGRLDHMVLDRTGIRGSYDFTLKWTPDQSQALGP